MTQSGPIGVLFDLPGVTQRQYELLLDALWLEEELPEGGLLHLAGPHPAGGWLVVDAWESEDAFERFARERLISAAKAVGIAPVKPRMFPGERSDHRPLGRLRPGEQLEAGPTTQEDVTAFSALFARK